MNKCYRQKICKVYDEIHIFETFDKKTRKKAIDIVENSDII